ncbi:MAG: choline kinase family protein [Pseudomonadota bacterium]
MTTDHTKELLHALENLEDFSGLGPDDLSFERLGGLTNLVYRVDRGPRPVIVRIPGEGTEAYIDRGVEIHNARVAAKTGVAPEVLWADTASGIMISACIENIVTMTPDLFGSRQGSAARAGSALRRLHDATEPFEFRFELFAMIEDYKKVLAAKNAELPQGYDAVVSEAGPIRDILRDKPGRLVPSHCDPLCENFLDDGQSMWIVDFEYSGMNDALWDLGDLSVEAGLTEAQEHEMLQAYFGRPATAEEHGRMIIYKAMCDLLWTLWGLIQHADGNPSEDFWDYASNRFSRCKTLMLAPDFAMHLKAVADV